MSNVFANWMVAIVLMMAVDAALILFGLPAVFQNKPLLALLFAIATAMEEKKQ